MNAILIFFRRFRVTILNSFLEVIALLTISIVGQIYKCLVKEPSIPGHLTATISSRAHYIHLCMYDKPFFASSMNAHYKRKGLNTL